MKSPDELYHYLSWTDDIRTDWVNWPVKGMPCGHAVPYLSMRLCSYCYEYCDVVAACVTFGVDPARVPFNPDHWASRVTPLADDNPKADES